MPLKPINYDRIYFYKLCCKDVAITDMYVGSTSNFTKRKQNHKKCCYQESNKGYNRLVYRFIRDHGGWDNWEMVLIEDAKCDNKLHMLKKEREYVEQLHATLNKQIPSRSEHEYNKQYKSSHKDDIDKYNKTYRDKHKDTKETCALCNRTYSILHKSDHNKSKSHQQALCIPTDDLNQFE